MSAEDIYFTIAYAQRVTDSLHAAGERAKAIGRAAEVRDAVRLLHNWLRADPESFGEPYRVHKGFALTEYLGFAGPLIVRYNIHHSSKHVFLLAPVRIARWARF